MSENRIPYASLFCFLERAADKFDFVFVGQVSSIMKNVHVFLIKAAANSLMSSHPGLPMKPSSHPGLPMKNFWWIDSNSYSQESMSSKTGMEH